MRMLCIFLGLLLILVPSTGEDLQKLDLFELVEVRNKCYHYHYYHKFLLSLLLLLLFKKIIIIIIIIIIMITKICSLKNYAVNYNTQTSSSQSD